MRRLLTTTALLVSLGAHAQWTTNGTNINNTNTGNVGIGTAAPTFKLDVVGSLNLSAGGQYNIGGVRVLAANGTQNLFLGSASGNAVTSGQRNALFGFQSGPALTTGSNNAFIGYRTGFVNNTGGNNIFIGSQTGYSNTTGSFNGFFGTNAGYSNTTADYGLMMGYFAGYSNTTGTQNAFIGYQAGYTNQSGSYNVALGSRAGYMGTGSYNAFIGYQAGRETSTGENNAYIGYRAGYLSTTGGSNTFIGNSAGDNNTTGSQNTYIGSNAKGTALLTNATAIGANATVSASNSLVLGSGVNVGIGVSAPGQKLHVAGNARITGAIFDSNNEAGAAGQVLSSTGSGTDWISVGSGAVVQGTEGQTQRHDGSSWVASSTLFNNGTNIGIGTSIPTAKLHVAGGFRVTGQFFDSNNDAGLNDLVLTSTATGTDWKDVCSIIQSCEVIQGLENGGWGYDSVAVQSQSGQTDMQSFLFMTDPGAFLGLGTASPMSKLSIETNGMNAVGSLMESAMTINITGSSSQTVRSAKFTGGAGVEVGNGLITDKVKITDGAADGKVLMSSATGDASWVDAVAAGLSGGWTNDSVTVMSYQTDTSSGEGQGIWVQSNYFGLVSTLPTGSPFLFGGYTVDYDSAEQNAGRMTYMSTSGAFRAGYDDQNNWGLAYQGIGSSAFGWNNKASGDYSDAAGRENQATGYASAARGSGSIASGDYSFVVGQNSTASGSVGIALGAGCNASGFVSIAGLSGSTASGSFSTAIGISCTASGFASTSFGYGNTSSGNRAFSSGYSNTAQSYGETVLGLFGTVGAGNASSFIGVDRLFVIGNGTGTTARSNALTILKNANTGIGNSAPTSLLHVGTTTGAKVTIGSLESISDGGSSILFSDANFRPATDNTRTLGGSSNRWTTVYAVTGTINTSDARDKENIKDLGYGMKEIMDLRPVTYRWRSGNDRNTKIGLIAQELQKVLPEVVADKEFVVTDEKTGEGEWKDAERLGVYYSDIIPVLVKGMQEQQQQLDSLKVGTIEVSRSEFESLKKENEQLKAQMDAILSRLNAFDTDLQQCCFDHSTADPSSLAPRPSSLDTPQLEQNQPNPFHENTTIKYYLPNGTRTASIVISDLNGVQLKSFDLSGSRGAGQVLISGGAFAAGTYVYTLTVNGKQVDSKRMVLM